MSFYIPYGGTKFTGRPASMSGTSVDARIATTGGSVTLPWSWTQSASANFVMTPNNKAVQGVNFLFELNFISNGAPGYASVGGNIEYVCTLTML